MMRKKSSLSFFERAVLKIILAAVSGLVSGCGEKSETSAIPLQKHEEKMKVPEQGNPLIQTKPVSREPLVMVELTDQDLLIEERSKVHEAITALAGTDCRQH